MFYNCPELLFLKGMTGALAPFTYLVNNKNQWGIMAETNKNEIRLKLKF
jgi:hypothetical protein